MIENKPYYALDDGLICNGASPEEIKTVIDNANTGFCLDIGHAICAANGFKLNRDSFIDRMMSLKPSMFHLTDGISADVYDKHLHFGKGDLNIKDILRTIPDKARITIETIKDSKKDLNDFEKDVKYLKRMF